MLEHAKIMGVCWLENYVGTCKNHGCLLVRKLYCGSNLLGLANIVGVCWQDLQKSLVVCRYNIAQTCQDLQKFLKLISGTQLANFKPHQDMQKFIGGSSNQSRLAEVQQNLKPSRNAVQSTIGDNFVLWISYTRQRSRYSIAQRKATPDQSVLCMRLCTEDQTLALFTDCCLLWWQVADPTCIELHQTHSCVDPYRAMYNDG